MRTSALGYPGGTVPPNVQAKGWDENSIAAFMEGAVHRLGQVIVTEEPDIDGLRAWTFQGLIDAVDARADSVNGTLRFSLEGENLIARAFRLEILFRDSRWLKCGAFQCRLLGGATLVLAIIPHCSREDPLLLAVNRKHPRLHPSAVRITFGRATSLHYISKP